MAAHSDLCDKIREIEFVDDEEDDSLDLCHLSGTEANKNNIGYNEDDEEDLLDCRVVWDSSTKSRPRTSPDEIENTLNLAQNQFDRGKYIDAFRTCQHGEALCKPNADGHTEFTRLIDDIAVFAASQGSIIGFPGRQLEVRSAGDEAWLGRPAPHDPALDGPLTEETALPSDDLTALADQSSASSSLPQKMLTNNLHATSNTASSSSRLVDWHYSDTLTSSMKHRTSFRCIKEALAAAKDGDRILLLRGIHNGFGESIAITKRVLIEGEGALGETVIDQRANCPTFRIQRSGAVLRNINFDHTGFREALRVGDASNDKTTTSKICPLIDGCIITCSGDDGINTSGSSSPWFRRCTITAKKCGIRAFDQSHPRLIGCTVEKCGEQGLKAMEKSHIEAFKSTITSCEEDGVVVMGAASVSLFRCSILDNKGPGVDCSDHSTALIRSCKIGDNVGSVWIWEESTADIETSILDGGNAHVILVDGLAAKPLVSKCTIKGTLHAPESAWKQGLLQRENVFLDPDVSTDFPPESGPFKYTPSPYRRSGR